MPDLRNTPSVVVVDSLRLRRGGIISFLNDWAASQGLQIEGFSPSGLPAEFEEQPGTRLVIVSIGDQPVSDPAIASVLRNLLSLISDAPLVLWSDNDDAEQVVEAFHIGVTGFLPTSMDPEIAVHALSFILKGGTFFPATALLAMPDLSGEREQEPPRRRSTRALRDDTPRHSLTDRQRDVVCLLRQGLPNKLIARQLEMTEATVKVHVRHIMRKLGAANRTQAALLSSQGQESAETGETEGGDSTPPMATGSSTHIQRHLRVGIGPSAPH
ncbi:MAG: response regulator transcription factor [Hyphomicrobiaceae bacterium]